MPRYTFRTTYDKPGVFNLTDILLEGRGITGKDNQDAFLNPDYDQHTYSPSLMKDMDKAVRRVTNAVRNNEKICIYSDFDCDGIPGAVVLSDFFKKISYSNFEHYIPHRHREGFGVHKAAIEKICDGGTKLIITIDCGIVDNQSVARAVELGADVIVTDHHMPGDELPPAFAILNPKQPGCEYPEKMLCGAAVIWKLVKGLVDSGNFEVSKGWEKWLLDMVGIATLSDMVPLTGENRVLARYGLTVLRKSPRPGLVQLFSSLKVKQRLLVEEDITFLVSPRINAASRMADPEDALVLLATKSETEADEAVRHLNKINDERKALVAVMVKEIKKKVEERDLGNPQSHPVIVLGNPDWKPPLLGLVATSLIREYRKPMFLWGRSDEGVIKGSCRSEGVTDVVLLMRSMPEQVFINRGGHAMSGGFSVASDHIHSFEAEILKSYAATFKALEAAEGDTASGGSLIADADISIDDVSWSLWDTIERLSPFGEANPKPVFILRDVTLGQVKMFGKKKEHAELMLLGSRRPIPAIRFFAEDIQDKLESLKEGQKITLAVNIEKSNFKNYPELRMRLVELL